MEIKKILLISGLILMVSDAVLAAAALSESATTTPAASRRKKTAPRPSAKMVPAVHAKLSAPVKTLTKKSSLPLEWTTSTAPLPQATPPPATFSGFLLAARSTSLYDFQDGTKSEGMDYTFRLAAKLSDNYGMKLTAIYSDDLRDKEEGLLQDTVLSVGRKPVPLGSYLLLSPYLGVGLPSSKASQDAGLQASAKAGLATLINPDKLFTGTKAVLVLIASKNMHTYETAKSGAVNQSYNVLQNLTLAHEWSAFSITLDLIHINTWSYQNVMRDSFMATEEIGWEVNKTFALGLGHTNGGSTLKADGVSSNVDLMNENSSMVYLSATLSF